MAQSVQSYTCSDEEQARIRSSPTTRAIAAQAPSHGAAAARLDHRALLALRQTGLQVRPRRGSRPQVLPLGELPWPATTAGLRAPGRLRAGQPVLGQSPAASHHRRRNLRDQSRTAAPPRGALSNAGGRTEPSTRPRHRHRCCRRAADQYGPELARCPPQPRCIGHGGVR